MKIATWNVNSLKVRLPQVLTWLKDHQPDVLCLQETKLTDENFPSEALYEADYFSHFSGQKAYNGVAILSRIPAKEVTAGFPENFPNSLNEQKRILCATVSEVRVVNVYVPNGQAVGTEKFTYKLEWLRHLVEYLRMQLERHPSLVLLGDLNIAPTDQDVHDPEAWHDKVLCSAQERQAFQALCQAGLQDCFRKFPQPENTFSWWDYRAAGFRRNLGLRIDHILASSNGYVSCQNTVIDKIPRGWPRPSDHTPVVAQFNL